MEASEKGGDSLHQLTGQSGQPESNPELKMTCISQDEGRRGHYRVSPLGVQLGGKILLLGVEEIVDLVRMRKQTNENKDRKAQHL